MGGGTDTDQGFAWQIKKANGGDFVVMRASGDDAYNQWIYDMSFVVGVPLNSVTTILFKDAQASSDPEVLNMISNAEALFFAGGDQSQYVDYWYNTDVQKIIQGKLSNVSVGGTSAGLAILGNYVYSAKDCSAESPNAMADPYYRCMDFAPFFLKIPFLDTVFTDSHFVTRDRMGRMLTFVARTLTDNPTLPVVRGLGIDEHTALLLDVTTGDVQTVGVGTAYLCTPQHGPKTCVSKQPETFTDLNCVRLSAVDQSNYSFSTWTGDGVAFVNTIVDGSINPEHYGPV